MERIVKITRLHLNKPQAMFSIPLQIIGLVLIVSAIVSFALQRAGLDASLPSYAEGARMNLGMVWSLPGFLIYFGVQAVATTFPFALALGATRRNYVMGTAIANLIQSLFIAAVMSVLLLIELATNHWFFGVYALDNVAFGSGNVGVLAITVFLGTFVALSIGGAFGAVWVRYGARGPAIVALVIGLLVAVLFLIFVPQFGEIIAAITRPKVAITAVAIAVVALLGTWLCMRRTSVR